MLLVPWATDHRRILRTAVEPAAVSLAQMYGARLVADDRTILFMAKGALHAKPPASIKGLLEVRGVGIIQLPVRC